MYTKETEWEFPVTFALMILEKTFTSLKKKMRAEVPSIIFSKKNNN